MKNYRTTCSILAFAMATAPAMAQEAEEAPAGLEEIIVTAQKRPEAAQKAPLVVTSLSADSLQAARVTGATELQRVIPNLAAQAGGGAGDPGGASTLFSIRGLGASPAGPQGSPGVAAHFDGIYQQSGLSNAEFYDLERIEVSPGPQGTLYGRSAAAGAVNVLPAKPENRNGFAASVTYGNYDTLITEAMANIAFSDQVMMRAAFQTQNHDGYFSNGYDDADSLSGRVQFLFEPDEALSIRLATQFVQIRGRGASPALVDGPALPNALAILPTATNADLRKSSIANYCFSAGQLRDDCFQSVRVNKIAAYADISYDFGGAVLTLLPALIETKRETRNAVAPLPFSVYDQQPYTNKQFNIEGRLSSAGDSDFKWVVGANYYRNKVDTFVDQFPNSLIRVPAPPPAPPGTLLPAVVMVNAFQDQQSEQSSVAIFGQATYPITDSIRVTVGGRYNHDKSSGVQVLGNKSVGVFIVNGPGPIIAPGVPFLAAPGIATPPQRGSQSFDAFTYRVAIDADIGPQSMVYASIGSGYKPGGLNDGGPLSSTVPANPLAPEQFFGPERVTHFEIGSKNRFLGNSLQLNVAAYYDDYKNYHNGQTQIVNPLAFGSLGFVVTNAGRAEVFGIEGSVRWQLSSNDEFEVAVNYLDAKFKDYIVPAYLGPSGPFPAIDISGFRLPNAAKISANVRYQHVFELGSAGSLTASAFSRLTSGYYVYFAQAPGTYQKGYTNTTLDLTWNSASEQFSASAFVSNLENEDVKVFASFVSNYTSVNLAPPRTYGVRFGVKF